MNNQKTNHFKLVYLSNHFYTQKALYIKELLFKPTRPYCLLLVQVKGLTFALPLRSCLPEVDGIGIKTISNPNKPGKYKGIDFSKAILITDVVNDIQNCQVQLKDKGELFFIEMNDSRIKREFKKYVQDYITCMKNGHQLEKKYKFTTLLNYHSELKISHTHT